MDSRPSPSRFRSRISRVFTRFRRGAGVAVEPPGAKPTSAEAPVAQEFPAFDISRLALAADSGSFAMKVSGHAMAGRHILEGDVVIIDPVTELHEGDVVAVVIHGQTVLRTLVRHRDLQFLRADNEESSDYIPAGNLPIRGVMRTLLRGSAHCV